MTTDSNVPVHGIPIETEALKALEFYGQNYTTLMFAGLGSANKRIVLGSKPYECRFCGGKRPLRTFKKRAHAISELLGNKIMESLYECDDCNKRFSTFEDDLAKMTLPARTIGGVIGKNGVPTLLAASDKAGHKGRIEFKGDTLHLSHDADHDAIVEDEVLKTITISYVEQPFHPLGAYKALCKSAFTLLPDNELPNFEELKQWLLQKDLKTDKVYSDGGHICFRTLVPAFKPFPQPVVALFKRKELIDSPYMSMLIAFGNISYQIFLPCPKQDYHMTGKNITFPPFPHYFQLQPWLLPAPITSGQIDLSAHERTTKKTGTIGFSYGNKVKVA